ncbi:hypothetical protein [Collinsella ihumii]|uniref:hypothetical protein n=1 Tax=Collinsella ihumii TaxID=1720204 RepID=UPI0025AA724D|nr:hypothetical protein [Collinsella ihumii]MDN0055974.1 hypothetical protein [Collinsella ihumii]
MASQSKECAIVKGISIFFLVFGIAAIAVAALMFFGAPHVDLNMEDGTQIAQLYAVIMALIGLFEFVTGFVGIRAAKKHSLLKPYVYLCAFMVVVSLAETAHTFMNGGGSVYMYLVYAATAFAGIVFASRAMKNEGVN